MPTPRNRSIFTGNGTQTAFTIDFEVQTVLNESPVNVYVVPSGKQPDEAADIVDPSLYRVMYTDSSATLSTATITMNTAPAIGASVVIAARVVTDRRYIFQNTTPFNIDHLNGAFEQLFDSLQIVAGLFRDYTLRNDESAPNEEFTAYTRTLPLLEPGDFYRRGLTEADRGRIIAQSYHDFLEAVIKAVRGAGVPEQMLFLQGDGTNRYQLEGWTFTDADLPEIARQIQVSVDGVILPNPDGNMRRGESYNEWVIDGNQNEAYLSFRDTIASGDYIFVVRNQTSPTVSYMNVEGSNFERTVNSKIADVALKEVNLFGGEDGSLVADRHLASTVMLNDDSVVAAKDLANIRQSSDIASDSFVAKKDLSNVIVGSDSKLADNTLSNVRDISNMSNVAKKDLSNVTVSSSSGVAARNLSNVTKESGIAGASFVADKELSNLENIDNSPVAKRDLSNVTVSGTSTLAARDLNNVMTVSSSANVADKTLSNVTTVSDISNVADKTLSNVTQATGISSDSFVADKTLSNVATVSGTSNVADKTLSNVRAIHSSSIVANTSLGNLTPAGRDLISSLGSGFPVGSIMHFALLSAPTGWLPFNGQRITGGAQTYRDLAKAINDGLIPSEFVTIAGNDLMMGNIEDFLRPKGGRSPSVGSVQPAAVINHSHSLRTLHAVDVNTVMDGTTVLAESGDDFFDGTTGDPIDGTTENRPKNVTVLTCIYAGAATTL